MPLKWNALDYEDHVIDDSKAHALEINKHRLYDERRPTLTHALMMPCLHSLPLGTDAQDGRKIARARQRKSNTLPDHFGLLTHGKRHRHTAEKRAVEDQVRYLSYPQRMSRCAWWKALRNSVGKIRRAIVRRRESRGGTLEVHECLGR
jgi:hypothetical protein